MDLIFTNVPVYTNVSWLRKRAHKIKYIYIYMHICVYYRASHVAQR